MYSTDYFNGMMNQQILDKSKRVFDKSRANPIPLAPQAVHHHYETVVEVEKPSALPLPEGLPPGYFEAINAHLAYEAYVFPLTVISRHLLEAKYIEPKIGKFETIASESLLKNQAHFMSTVESIGPDSLSLITSSDLKYMQNFFAYLNKSNDLIYSSALNVAKSRFRTNDQRALLERDLLDTEGVR
mgnify:CR=1 FL=1